MAKNKEQDKPKAHRIANRKARFDFHILEQVECGIELVGTEVKSLRAGNAKIDDAYARVQNGQLYLVGASISHYPLAAPQMQHEMTRDRRLLLHRRQIVQLLDHVKQKGKTLIPLAVYFKAGWAKVEIGVAVGKKMFDKRQDLKKRDAQRDIAREMGRRRRDI